jgi:hypothetical protein
VCLKSIYDNDFTIIEHSVISYSLPALIEGDWYSVNDFRSEGMHLLGDNTGQVSVEFDFVPYSDNINGVAGYAGKDTEITGYASFSFMFRAYSNGYFDVYNNKGYTALTKVPYSANQLYHVRMTVDLDANTYDAWVTPPEGTEIQLADHYAFRAATPNIDDLGKVFLRSTYDDDFSISNHTVTYLGTGTPTPTPTPTPTLTPTPTPTQTPVNKPPVWTDAVLTAGNITANSVDLLWSGASDDSGSVAGYNIYQITGDSRVFIDSTAQSRFTISGLSPNTSYHFKVEAVDGEGAESADGPFAAAATLPSDANAITSFSVPGQIADAVILPEINTVLIVVDKGTNINKLVPAIGISEGATIKPESGKKQNFLLPVIYTVTAQNGDKKHWVVIIIKWFF